ncbi:MAG: ATP-binding protein [Acidobacteriota bacterium]
MSLRRRLLLTLIVVFSLFALNLVVSLWGSAARGARFDALRRAIHRQAQVLQVDQALRARRQEVRVMTSLAIANPDAAALDADQAAQLRGQLDELDALAAALSTNGEDTEDALALGQLRDAVRAATAGWRATYDRLQSDAGSDAVDRTDAAPSGEADDEAPRTAGDVLTALAARLEIERARVQSNTQRHSEVSELVDRVTTLLFIVSLVLALLLTIGISTRIGRGIVLLRRGAAQFGAGNLQHRIPVERNDEFGQVSSAFNNTALRLLEVRAALEQARADAERASRAKSTFLANMSHELRTPLNAILGYGEMLQEEASELPANLRPRFAPDLDKILTAGRHLLTLINDILDLSKIEAGKTELHVTTFAVDPLLDEVGGLIQPLVARNGNRLIDDRGGDASTPLGQMHGDETKLRQMLFNLLSNAAKFTEDGTITLHVRRQSDADGAPSLVFSVADTGIGMDDAQLARVFDAFTQAGSDTAARYGGTGLGLAITRHFCDLMDGQLDASSRPGRGSTFTLTVPARAAGENAA